MMKKKLLIFGLTCLTAVTMLTGCRDNAEMPYGTYTWKSWISGIGRGSSNSKIRVSTGAAWFDNIWLGRSFRKGYAYLINGWNYDNKRSWYWEAEVQVRITDITGEKVDLYKVDGSNFIAQASKNGKKIRFNDVTYYKESDKI